MSKEQFTPDELVVSRYAPAIFGPPTPVLSTPITPKENLLRLYEGKTPMWAPFSFGESNMVMIDVDPENVARSPGNPPARIDGWGVEWIFVDVVGGAMVKPGKPLVTDIDDLMMLCEADITSKNSDKIRRYRHNFEIVRDKLVEIEEKDRLRNWQPPISGEDIMRAFDLKPCRTVGDIKDAVCDAILDGDIENTRKAAWQRMIEAGVMLGLTPVNPEDVQNQDE